MDKFCRLLARCYRRLVDPSSGDVLDPEVNVFFPCL